MTPRTPSLLPTARALALGLCTLLATPLAFAILPIQHWVQPSGAQVYFVQSPDIPMVDVQLDFDGGSRRDPPGQAGLASVMAGQLRNGIPGMDENQLGEAWADLGASFGIGASGDRLSAALRSLTDPALLPQAIDLASRQLAQPSFPPELWARDRARIIASLREAYTRPATVAQRNWSPAVFGGHPYGWEPTEESLNAIGVQDLRAFHARHLQACRARATVVGAVSREQADRLVAQLLARLPGQAPAACESLPRVPEVPPLAAPVTREIPFASAQAHVLIGQPGYKRDDPDYFPLVVGNYILGGGGFVSRLYNEVREKRGLSYSVYSYFAPGLHAGAFGVGLQTRPDQARQAVQVAQDVVARFVSEGPTEAELKAAKDNLVGGFALRIDTNRKLLDNVSTIAWHGLPLDYLDTWRRQVQAVTVADIRAAFARKLQPGRMVTVIVGGGTAVSAASPAAAPAR